MHLTPEELSQVPTPDLSLPPTRSGQIITRPEYITYSYYYDAHHQDNYLIQDQMLDPISFISTPNKETTSYHGVIKQPDYQQFVQDMVKELNGHITKGHWSLLPISKVPANTNIIDSVWSMKRKREIISRKIYKWKVRLNVHGGQQEKGVNYNDTYSPVVGWVFHEIPPWYVPPQQSVYKKNWLCIGIPTGNYRIWSLHETTSMHSSGRRKYRDPCTTSPQEPIWRKEGWKNMECPPP